MRGDPASCFLRSVLRIERDIVHAFLQRRWIRFVTDIGLKIKRSIPPSPKKILLIDPPDSSEKSSSNGEPRLQSLRNEAIGTPRDDPSSRISWNGGDGTAMKLMDDDGDGDGRDNADGFE